MLISSFYENLQHVLVQTNIIYSFKIEEKQEKVLCIQQNCWQQGAWIILVM